MDMRDVRRMLWISGLAGLLLAATGLRAQGQGYRLTSNQLIVDRRQHWENWIFPQGTLDISPDGQVLPHRVRKNIDATQDILNHLWLHSSKSPAELSLLDAVQAGSNRRGVLQAIDGDPLSYWEPDRLVPGADIPSQWWFILDMGRFVLAEKIVVRFVEEGLGDPFLLFDVLISEGVSPAHVPGVRTPEFRPALRMLQPNKTQRVFEIDLRNHDEEVQAAGVRYVQMVITGSDQDRGQEVSLEEYEQLTGQDRGAVEYRKRLPDGREAAVDEALYFQLEAAEQGGIYYYRRERPRLAGLEVWTKGDEIISGAIARGGGVQLTAREPATLAYFVDGNVATNFSVVTGVVQHVPDPDRYLIFDLGSFYWVDTNVLAYSRGVRRGALPNYGLDVSDGSRAGDGSLYWRRVMDRAGEAPFDHNRFAPVKARFFRLGWIVTVGAAQVADLAQVQLYGEGYQPEVWLESELIRLPATRNLLSIEWDADAPPGTRVSLQTRTGNELEQRRRYFKTDGSEVTEGEYNRLLSIFRGEILVEEMEGGDWSDWSEEYEAETGSVIRSPSPRQYLKIRAVLRSDTPEASAALRSLRLNFTPPAAQRLVGEVTPVAIRNLGVEETFSLFIRPQFDAQDPGFDELLLVGGADMSLSYEGIYSGDEQTLGLESDVSGVKIGEVTLVPTRADSLWLRFPRIGPQSGVELLRLDFRTALYGTGTMLRAALQNSAIGQHTWQRVDAGNATQSIETNSMTVLGIAQRKELITDLNIYPPVFTPNGDGINDVTEISFSVVLVDGAIPVKVVIYDLGGRLIRQMEERRQVSTGEYGFVWDGTNEAGELAPPGMYVVRLSLEADTRGSNVSRKEVLRTVGVVY